MFYITIRLLTTMRNVVNADVELYQNLLPLNGVMKHLVYVV